MVGERDAVIVAGVRTPFAKAGTLFRAVPAEELARVAIREVVERAELDPDAVDGVVVGVAGGFGVARAAALLAKLPARVPALSVGRGSASGLDAIVEAAQRIRAGDADVVVAAAVESASGAPGPVGPSLPGSAAAMSAAAEAAERLAREFDLGREEQDAFALRSHRLAAAAWSEGRMSSEVLSVPIPPEYEAMASKDNCVRDDASAEALAALAPAVDHRFGTVTSGNSAPAADGAVALVLASAARARALGLGVLGRVRSWGFAGCEAPLAGLGPVLAAPVALRRAGGLALERMEIVELDEAFAAQAIACLRAFGSRSFCERNLGGGPVGDVDPGRANVNGGAIAIGHPAGAGGARLVLALLSEMARRDASLGLVALCSGDGQGGAMIVERD